MIVVLVGESASGKSTVEDLIVKNNSQDFQRVISYTTRPMRDGEVADVNYHYVSEEEFADMVRNGEFIEKAQYRGWNYGSNKKDYRSEKNIVVVLTPHGCRSLKKWFSETKQQQGTKIISVYFYVDRRSRLMKILERGDDIEEAYRRNLSDVGQFDGFADEADYVISNDGYKKGRYEVYGEVMSLIWKELENEKS